MSDQQFIALMAGAEMHPRIFRGEAFIFDKAEQVELDDDVVFILADGRSLVRRLVAICSDHYVIATFNPVASEALPRLAVKEVYPITGRCDASTYHELAAERHGKEESHV